MANKGGPTQIWRHVGGEGGYKYLDDMPQKSWPPKRPSTAAMTTLQLPMLLAAKGGSSIASSKSAKNAPESSI